MNFYEKKIKQLKSELYANQWQIDSVIGTRNYIDNNLEKDLNLDLLSHIRGVSKYHLLRLFKRYYGQTPRQYLIDKRVKESKELLVQGYSVTETCHAVGLESPASFSALFKRRTGFSPSEYQKKQLSISE